ncbi:Crp/Fnr family transcriptional regulator [Maribacter sp. IgM3_T14_3]|uniref:Crp/Fnr family transcriptional regulator n=1 Tax=Maribacter sp. IgM3_T14_3 TaxID=3415140 RepID=UPI003C6FF928
MKNILKDFLLRSIKDSDAVLELCSLSSPSYKVSKNQYVLKKYQKENCLYFISSGCIALMVQTEKKDNVLGFGYQNSIITSFLSFASGLPSDLSLLAISDVELIKIPKKGLMHLVNNNSTIANWYNKLIKKTLIGHLNREIEMLTLSSKERYVAFLNRSGHLVNSIPLKYISSYLNMTPETLSRVRKTIS